MRRIKLEPNIWYTTAETKPATTPGNQVTVLMWSREWAIWLPGMFTCIDGGAEDYWSFYDTENDRYSELTHIPEFWMKPLPPGDDEYRGQLPGL